MPGRSIRIARIAGIPVGISPLWLVIVALITWSLGADYYPGEVHGIAPHVSYLLGLASALLLFASILAHELGHALVARRRGIEIEEIDLWLLGGVARMRGRPKTATDELLFASAGPAVTAFVALLFGGLAIALHRTGSPTLRAIVDYQAEVNLMILVFNLMPAFPLDGGRVARALLWRRSGDLGRATASAARWGSAFGYALVAFGVVLWLGGGLGGIWLAVIGVFLVLAAKAERVQQLVVTRFTGVTAGAVMSRPAVTISATISAEDAGRYFSRYRFRAFPVVDSADRVIGLLSLDAVARVSPADRATTPVEMLADRDPELIVDVGTDIAELLDNPHFQRFGRVAVIDAAGHAVGLLSVTDLDRTLRAEQILIRT